MENTKLKEVEIPQISTSAEETLTTVGTIILIIGIFATLALLCTSVVVEIDEGWHSEKQFDPVMFVLTLGILFSSLTIWAVLRVIANISLRLKAIQETMPRRMITEEELKVIQASERKAVQTVVKSDFLVGETVLYKGNKYPIEKISESTGKLCIYRGSFAGYAWVFPDEVTKVEE